MTQLNNVTLVVSKTRKIQFTLFCCYFPCFVAKLFCDLRAFCVEKYLAKNLVHGEKRTNSRLEQKSKWSNFNFTPISHHSPNCQTKITKSPTLSSWPMVSDQWPWYVPSLLSSCLPSFNNNKNMYTCGDIIIRKWHKYSLCKRTGLSNRKQMMPNDLFCSRYTSLAMSFTRSLYWNEPVSRQKIFKPNKYLDQRWVIQYIYFSRMVQFRYI